MYKAPDPFTHTAALSAAMIFTQDMSQILKEVYEETVFDEVDLEDCRKFATECNYENCKIVVAGKDLRVHRRANAEEVRKVSEDLQAQKDMEER